jgi:2,4-dienoyl-CoA reductase-like NADH-dependent reductase (Old Yellow Enzyme family)
MLFDPLALRSVQLRNRIGVSPMCQYTCHDGLAGDWHLVHLGSRAVGGAGLVFTEAAAVTADGRISPADLGIWKDEHVPPLAKIVAFVEQYGAVAGIQLAHAGRKASTAVPWEGGKPIAPEQEGWRPIWAPSPLPFDAGWPIPSALEEPQIVEMVTAFREAAVRARAANFRVVEIHAAHGYLLHSFLSPVANQRNDLWGGSFENRIRLLRHVVGAVRGVWPDGLPVFVRLSATDWLGSEGWTIEDSIALARRLREDGVDVVDCSSAGIAPNVRIDVGPGYQTPLAERVRREAGIATAAVGMITSAVQAEHILRTGQADIVLLARQMLRDPYWPRRAAEELRQTPFVPKQYARS